MTKDVGLTIAAPNLVTAVFGIRGNAPYVQHAFPAKAREMMKAKQVAGSTAKKGAKREAKDFLECYNQAMHRSREGWHGIPAAGLRCSLIDACRLAGYQMVRAKMSIFVVADGFDALDGTPLVRLNGEPRYVEHAVRNDSGVADIRARPMWNDWSAQVTLRWDADQFTTQDVANLLMRAGMQVGIGEGRPLSKNSAGMGWGTFDIDAAA